MTILPVSTSTASEKLRTILLVVATAVALSAGEEELKEGLVSSAVVKLYVVLSLIPAYELLEESSKAVAAICT